LFGICTMKNFFLYFVVSVGGAAVLAIELLGTRILGPFYGVSIFLWSALISVTLIALSAGYFIGGSLADRFPSLPRLCVLVAAAGIWVVIIPLLKHPVLSLAETFGLRWAVLCSAFVLFFPPLALLGIISPYAVKLKTQSLDVVARSAGTLYAVSTLASVVAALVTGFYLIPNFGIVHLTMCVGIILLLTAVVGFVLHRKMKAASVGATLTLLAGVLLATSTLERPDPSKGLLAVVQSPYAELRVLDIDDTRDLLIDGAIHSMVDTATWESYYHYVAVMDLPKYFFEKPGTMLLLGVGAGSLVKQYHDSYWKVDAVDIDPTVVQLAREYFNLQPSDGNIFVMDGRKYLATTDRYYDVILCDAFGSSEIPFHLVTEEAFGLAASRLNRGGMFALNVETLGWDDPIIKTLIATLKRVFANVVALPQEEPPNRLGNVVILASQKKIEPLREPERNDIFDPNWRYGPGYQKVHAWDNHFTTSTANIEPLTDDLNPIEIRAEEIKFVARRDLHEYFEENGLSW
jgi:spermidine synthase